MQPLPDSGSALPPEHARALEIARHGESRRAVEELSAHLADTADAADRQRLARTLAQLARIAEEQRDPQASIAALDFASTLVDWADLHCHRGQLLAQLGRRADARRALDRALVLNPRYRAAVVERALLDAREGRIAEAMETLRMLARDGDVTEPSAFEQGMVHLGHADFEDAGRLLRRALHASDEWLQERLHAVQAMSERGEHGAALQILREAVIERAAYPDLHLLLGVHELQAGSVDDAIESFSQALELNPDFHTARVAFARALEASGDTRQALAQLESVMRHEPDHREAGALHQRLAGRRRGVRTPA